MTFTQYRILLVDDEEWVLVYLQKLLETEDYQLDQSKNPHEALELISQNNYDLVLCDIHLEPIDGMECLRRVKAAPDAPEVIMITGHASIDSAITAMKQGAFDYLTKPFDQERVLSGVSRALDHRKLLMEVQSLRKQVNLSHDRVSPVTVSPLMKDLLSIVDAVAKSDTPVLVEGETGTGKEVIAREVHKRSLRSEGPFIPINCAALPESLLESELFGYKKGAFTGATTEKKGLFESAEGGTILLDEIGEMPFSLQATLLRVLQNGEIRRVGSTVTHKTNARIIAVTNRSLKTMVENGGFREDLYYRLRVVPVVVPPLRDRPEDILPLAKKFLDLYGNRSGKDFRTIDPNAAQYLLGYRWPGNVRELENLIRGIVTLFDAKELQLGHIAPLLRAYKNGQPATDSLSVEPTTMEPDDFLPLAEGRERAEKLAILSAISENRGSQEDTAKALGISRTSLWRKMKKYEVS